MGARAGMALGAAVLTAATLMATTIGTAGSAQAMSGGTQLPRPGATPWLATLAEKGATPLLERASCGGVLIAPDRILTAAHCVNGVDVQRMEVHLGSSVLSQDPGTVRGIRSATLHPRFELLPSPAAPNSPEMSSAAYDIAVLRLDTPVRGIKPLPVTRHRPRPGTPVSIFSHGTTAPTDSSRPGTGIRGDVLRRGDLIVRSHERCAAQTPAVVDEASVFCARDARGGLPDRTPTTMCTGDSGSPLVAWGRRGPELTGIFSFAGETAGKVCGQPADAAFADVPALLPDLTPSPLPLEQRAAARPDGGHAPLGCATKDFQPHPATAAALIAAGARPRDA
ncbi:S1 family peptidase [Streptomyces monomycini]|uniref:S1 family peptidase n=1 Tax=Streptomyces monomycini TaxID=371720 RepID=UPI000AAB4107|nr:serine protease [Streptomyces monomycini]